MICHENLKSDGQFEILIFISHTIRRQTSQNIFLFSGSQ